MKQTWYAKVSWNDVGQSRARRSGAGPRFRPMSKGGRGGWRWEKGDLGSGYQRHANAILEVGESSHTFWRSLYSSTASSGWEGEDGFAARANLGHIDLGQGDKCQFFDVYWCAFHLFRGQDHYTGVCRLLQASMHVQRRDMMTWMDIAPKGAWRIVITKAILLDTMISSFHTWFFIIPLSGQQ